MAFRQLVPAVRQSGSKRLQLFAFEYGPSAGTAAESPEGSTVVRGVQFASKLCVPAFRRTEPASMSADSLDDPQVAVGGEFGNAEVVGSRKSRKQLTAHHDPPMIGFQVLCPRDAKAAGDIVGRSARRGRQQHESQTSVDCEEASTVVQACHRVDVSMVEQVPAQRSGAAIRHNAGRQHKANAPTSACQLKRALNEELVAVEMRAVFDGVDAGFAYEVCESPRVHLPVGSNVRLAAVSAEHVPGRIADDGVESRRLKRVAPLIAEDFRKRQRPMEETVVCGQRG
jgi:hypothetical protein